MLPWWVLVLIGCGGEVGDDPIDADAGGDDTDADALDTDVVDTELDDTAAPLDSALDTDDSDVMNVPDSDLPEHPTWSGDVAGLFSGSCRPCHVGSVPPNGDLSLDGSAAALVDVPSTQLSTMDLVEPGDPLRSYLWLKLTGAHVAAGGSGRRMPLSGRALQADELRLVRLWIEQGAAE